jgi:hypothetical protein
MTDDPNTDPTERAVGELVPRATDAFGVTTSLTSRSGESAQRPTASRPSEPSGSSAIQAIRRDL